MKHKFFFLFSLFNSFSHQHTQPKPSFEGYPAPPSRLRYSALVYFTGTVPVDLLPPTLGSRKGKAARQLPH
jgi:hypothetical protein